MKARLERRYRMCYEFEREYYRQVAEEARKAREREEKRKEQEKVPAKPAERDKTRELDQPLPV
jgi:hypothetical protein